MHRVQLTNCPDAATAQAAGRRALWKDILDVATARSREREPSERWATVRARLAKAGRLKKGRRRA